MITILALLLAAAPPDPVTAQRIEGQIRIEFTAYAADEVYAPYERVAMRRVEDCKNSYNKSEKQFYVPIRFFISQFNEVILGGLTGSLYSCLLFLAGIVCLGAATLCFLLMLGVRGVGIEGHVAFLLGCIGFTFLSYWFVHLALSPRA